VTSLDTLIVKFAAPCNLNCTYCYEYAAGDTSWRSKPKKLSVELAAMIGRRIREYCEETGVGTMSVVAHGGEPLLVGAAGLDAILGALAENASPYELRFSIQTNGTLLTPEVCRVLADREVTVGVSIDGSRVHNHRRVDHRGLPTFDRVLHGIETLRATPGARLGGLLCVVDLEHEPEEVIDALCSIHPPMVDLLQPFLTHDAAGPRRAEIAQRFGDWMTRALAHWVARSEFAGIRVRVLEDALKASLTGRPETDWFGPRRVRYLIVETDGSYDLLDQLKAIGAASAAERRIGRSLADCSLSDAARLAADLLSVRGAAATPAGCRGCRWEHVCAGGHLPARYSSADGFDNPSVYCEGIQSLLDAARGMMCAASQMRASRSSGTT
jgi:uncharacterized protein